MPPTRVDSDSEQLSRAFQELVRNRDRRLVWLPTGLLIGGAAGNLIDRIREGAVTDFVDVSWWPAFNVADVAITFGVVTLLYVLETSHGARSRA